MRAWLLAVIAAVLGCSDPKRAEPGRIVEVRDQISGERVPLDTIPQEILDTMAETSRQQARGMDGATTTLLRAWNYQGPPAVEIMDGLKRVAIEMTLVIPGTTMDPDDLDIIDAENGENHGSGPWLQRLTAAGEPADWKDPVFTDQHRFRLVAVWVVPDAVDRVQVGYWGAVIAGPIDVTGTGPALPEEREQAIAIGTAGKTSDGRLRHLLVVECFCARNASPPWVNLVIGPDDFAKDARAVEVDAAFEPIAPAPDRPFYLRRWWVVEQWSAARPIEVNRFGDRTPLPGRRLVPSKALRAALDAAPVDPLARE